MRQKACVAMILGFGLMLLPLAFADDSKDQSSSSSTDNSISGTISDWGNRISNATSNMAQEGVKSMAIDTAVNNPGAITSVVRGLKGAGQKDTDLQHVNKMYNNAPAGSDERKRLNDLYVRVQNGDTKARQEVNDMWVNYNQPKPEKPSTPAPSEPATPPNAPSSTPPKPDNPSLQTLRNVRDGLNNQTVNNPSSIQQAINDSPEPVPANPHLQPPGMDTGPAPRDNSDLGRGFGGSTLPEQIHLAENHLWNMQNLVDNYNNQIKDLQDQIHHGGDKSSLQGEITRITEERDDTIRRHLQPTQEFLNAHPQETGGGEGIPTGRVDQGGNDSNVNPHMDDASMNAPPGDLNQDLGNEMQNLGHEPAGGGDLNAQGGQNEQPSHGDESSGHPSSGHGDSCGMH